MTPDTHEDLHWIVKLEAETARLGEIRRFVEQVAQQAAVSPERAFDLKVAVSEAFANAVEHARCPQESVEVSARLQARRLTFVIVDTGIFRPPTAGGREAFGYRGLGLPLMVTLMDEVSFFRSPGGGTRVSLSVHLDREPATV
jgi:anti-sigma regulatory factor (Ser/Thr protein kinase)